MSQPDSGSGADPVGDRNLRPRRISTTRDFYDPSPSATSTRHHRPPATGPQANSHYYTRAASNSIPSGHGGESTKDVSDSSSEGGDQLHEVSKLEVKREKNRLKQRNLRQRRANHITQLEDQVRHLKRDCTTFRDHITTKSTIVAANETKYRSWITGLEAALDQRGLGGEAEGLRHAWGSAIQAVPTFPHNSGRVTKGSKKGKTTVKTEPLELTVNGPLGDQISQMDTSRRGSISTLVQAAMVADSRHVHPSPTYPNHQQSQYQNHHHQQPSDGYKRALPPPHLPLLHPGTYHPPQDKSRVPIVYPGSMEALRQPPSPSRYVHRARTIPTSARPTWPNYDSRPQHPNLPPPEAEDRKRKRSLSGPTLHSGAHLSLPPILSSSAPSSGQINQSRSLLGQMDPPLATLPGSASRPPSRPTSSHQIGTSVPSAWNTLAPIRLQATHTSRPTTPSGLSHPFTTSIMDSTAQHIKVSDLLADRSGGRGGDGSSFTPGPQQKSSSWPMPSGQLAKGAMPISDLLAGGTRSRESEAGPSRISTQYDVKKEFYAD